MRKIEICCFYVQPHSPLVLYLYTGLRVTRVLYLTVMYNWSDRFVVSFCSVCISVARVSFSRHVVSLARIYACGDDEGTEARETGVRGNMDPESSLLSFLLSTAIPFTPFPFCIGKAIGAPFLGPPMTKGKRWCCGCGG